MKKLLLILLCVPLIGLGQEIDSQILQPLKTVEEMPLFGDCTDEECTTNEIMKFIAENFIYPEISKLDGVEGRVIAEFVVEKDGKVGRVKILSGVDEHIDKAVIEVIKKLPRFTPGKQLGKPVAVKYTVPVKCTIDDEDFISTFPLVGAKYSTNFDGKSWVGIDVTIFSITDEISGKKMDMFVFGYSRTINNETNLMDGHINDFSFELGKYRYAGPFLYTSIYQFGFMNADNNVWYYRPEVGFSYRGISLTYSYNINFKKGYKTWNKHLLNIRLSKEI